MKNLFSVSVTTSRSVACVCVSEGARVAASGTMWFSPENSCRMSSFKTKIRRRKYALNGKDNGERDGAKGVPANWEFVNFNPVMFGRRNLPPGLDEVSDEEAVRRRPRTSPPPSRPPSWLAALPHHCLLEDPDPGNRPHSSSLVL